MTRKLLVKTLLDRAKTIPTNSALQAQETENVVETLKLNGYQKRFIEKVVANNHQTNTNAEYEIRGSTCLHYVNGVSEKVKSILTNAGRVKTNTNFREYFSQAQSKSQNRQKTEQKLLYTNTNAENDHLHISANQRDVGRQGG